MCFYFEIAALSWFWFAARFMSLNNLLSFYRPPVDHPEIQVQKEIQDPKDQKEMLDQKDPLVTK